MSKLQSNFAGEHFGENEKIYEFFKKIRTEQKVFGRVVRTACYVPRETSAKIIEKFAVDAVRIGKSPEKMKLRE